MAFLIIMPTMKTSAWARRIRASEPDIDLRVWPATGARDDIEFALAWRHPPGEFRRFPNLKCIASMGAGVDNLLSDPDLPAGVPITRIVDVSVARSMSEYVVMSVLNYCRNTRFFMEREAAEAWQPAIPRLAEKETIGILGVGQLGLDAARKLMALGFKVAVWRRSDQRLDVFRTEPLPQKHPFWQQPAITVTPHIASLTNPAAVIPQIMDNYRRIKAVQAVFNRIDRDRGY